MSYSNTSIPKPVEPSDMEILSIVTGPNLLM